jgi:integrase
MSKHACRPLNSREYRNVLANFHGYFSKRNRLLFVLGCKTGFRVSELLSIRVRDILQDSGRLMDRVTVAAANMKAKKRSRTIALHPDVRPPLRAWLHELRQAGYFERDTFLFKARQGGNRPISRVAAWKILKRVYRDLGMEGVLATHTLRKTFAARVFRHAHRDVLKTQAALGHESLDNTARYLQSIDQKAVDRLILSA